MEKLEFGFKCKDIITGTEGILNARVSFITGCDRVELIVEEGKKKWFDVPTITIVDEGVSKELKETGQCNQYNDVKEALYDFGVVVEDIITGFKGKIVSKSISVSGDIAYGVSQEFNNMNRSNDAIWFDEGRLEVKNEKKAEIKKGSRRVGGAVPDLKYM